MSVRHLRDIGARKVGTHEPRRGPLVGIAERGTGWSNYGWRRWQEASSPRGTTRSRQASQPSGLTVFSDLSLSSALITPILGAFQRRHPDLEIRILSSFEPIETTDERFDVGLQYGRNEASSLVAEPIGDDTVFPVCSPDFASKLPRELTAVDVAALPLLHVDYSESAWTDWHQFLAPFGVEISNETEGLTFTSYLVCLDVAEQGEGLALGWGHTVQPRLDAGDLVRLTELAMPRPNAIMAYRSNDRVPDPLVDEFLSIIRDALSHRPNDKPADGTEGLAIS